MFFSLLLLLSLVTFHSGDPSLNHVTSAGAKVQNKAGLFGAYMAGALNDFFGIAAFAWPVCLGSLGAGFISLRFDIRWWRWCGYVLMALCLLASGAAWNFSLGDVRGGGMLGRMLFSAASLYLSPAGSALLLVFVLLIATQLSFDISWISWAQRLVDLGRSLLGILRMAGGRLTHKDGTDLPETQTGPHKKLDKSSLREKLSRFGLRGKQSGVETAEKQKTSGQHGTPHWAALCAGLRDRVAGLMERFRRKPPVVESMPVLADMPPARPALADFEPLERTFDAVAGTSPAQNGADPQTAASAEGTTAARPYAAAMPAGAQGAASVDGDDDALTQQAAGAQGVSSAGAGAAVLSPSPVESSSFGGPAEAAAAQGMMPSVPVTEAEDVELVYTENGAVVPHEGGQGSVAAADEPAHDGLVALLTGERRKAKIPFPPVDLLALPAASTKPSTENCEERGRLLVNCLAEFGIEGTLERITPGPVVTMYEYKPAAGVRVRRIENLVDDVARALKAKSIRIQAPIPGLDTVGIEIPNEDRKMVNFREILTNAAFTEAASPLTMVIGKDIAGRPFTADLAVMPHLLVAGATGQGKSVCINSIIMSLLYKARPEELQLLLVDPKRVEFAVYADLPYLVHPVVTEMDHAKAALDWAVHEMDQRYDAMSRMGVRNIKGYNEKVQKLGENAPPDVADCKPMPFLVIIIDELADLMMTASRREVENSIVRLAQLARAAGIHMILATQRPSVDVVTGLIKANFPCRISFKVSQKVDSRTILDAMGAEALLGCGDMLFKPSSGRMLRMHGPFVSDDEVANVVNYWKRQQKPHYQVDFSEWNAEGTGGAAVNGSGDSGGSSDDALYGEVLKFVTEQGKASISLIQRRFKIGFNRAARLFEELERDGVVGPADGAKPRSVVR